MSGAPTGIADHRVLASDPQDVRRGTVRYAPIKSLWFLVYVGGQGTISVFGLQPN